MSNVRGGGRVERAPPPAAFDLEVDIDRDNWLAHRYSVDNSSPRGNRRHASPEGAASVSPGRKSWVASAKQENPAGTAQSVVVEDRGKGRLESAQCRFYDFNLWNELKRAEKLRYLHRKPVNCGPVAEPEHSEGSSYRSYRYQEEGRAKINQRLTQR